MTYAFLAFIAFIAFLGAAAAAFAAFLAILLSTGERSKPQGMRMSLKTSFLGHEGATTHRCPHHLLFLAKNQQSDVVLGTESGVPGTSPESQDPDAAQHPASPAGSPQSPWGPMELEGLKETCWPSWAEGNAKQKFPREHTHTHNSPVVRTPLHFTPNNQQYQTGNNPMWYS